jgi:hypothetical protein
VSDTLRRVTAQQRDDGAIGAGVRVEYDFVPTQDDYVALLRNMPMMRAATVLAWFVLVVVVLAVVLSFFVVDSNGQPAGDLGALGVLVVFGGTLSLTILGYARIGGMAAWRKPQNREPVRAALDADGLSHEGPSGRQAVVWGIASRARESAEGYYVYVPNGLASAVYWLPKRAVPAGEQATVRERIQAHVPRYEIR